MTDTTTKRTQSSKPDLKEAKRFLAALDPNADTFCFQSFDDNPDRDLRDKKLAGIDTGTFDDVQDWLVRANGRHAGIFVSINPTDGHGRTKKNITGVRALMLDLDGKPVDPVNACALKPHIITETSEGHFHALWRVDGLALDQFEGVQRGLAKRFDGDPAVATLERCTRLPGFFHCKDIDNRFRTRIITTNEHAAYSAEEILAENFRPTKPHKAPRLRGGRTNPACGSSNGGGRQIRRASREPRTNSAIAALPWCLLPVGRNLLSATPRRSPRE